MEEQSDTPRTEMAEGQGLNPYFEGRFDGESDELCALRLTLARERDEARAIANDRDAMVDHRDRALTAMYQQVATATRERDEARAELTACGAIALANTRESAVAARNRLPRYLSASSEAVARTVDREMRLREEVEKLRSALRNLLVMLPSDLSVSDFNESARVPAAFCYVRWIDIKEGHAALATTEPNP